MENNSVNKYDLKYLDEMLGSFCAATGLHIEAVNDQGVTFFAPGGQKRCEFCEFINSNPARWEKCRASYQRANQEAAKWDEPYFFRCHAGLVIWAVPIVIEGTSFGSIICGQVLLWEPDDFFWQELRLLSQSEEDFIKLKETSAAIEVVSPARTQAAAEMLFIVVNHIIKRNINILEGIEESRRQQQQIRQELEERKKAPVAESESYGSYLRKERKLLRYIRIGDRTRAEKTLQSLLTDLYSKGVGDKKTVRARIIELASLVSRAAVEGGADAERAMITLRQFNDEVDSMESMEEFFYKVHKVVEEFLDDIFALADKKYLSLVKEARNYMVENLSKQIKVEDVASHLFISSSHLSRLFRQEMGYTVNDYLTRVRVEKAVELMKKPEMSVAQVSKAVGFKSQSYFAKVFNKFIGVTPLVYKNSLF